MIVSFGDASTEDLYHGRNTARTRHYPGEVKKRAKRKLDSVNSACLLGDLNLPGNRLEALAGTWEGWHSIRVNDQWRVVFRWSGQDATDVVLSRHDY